MWEKLLARVSQKYEYLNFNDTKVLTCFQSAYQYLETNAPEVLSNESVNGLELEYHFLHELVLCVKNGNEEIKDALLFGLENTHDFFLRKRRDLADKVPKEKRYALYSLAFDKMLESYDEKKPITSCLMQSIIDTYKQYDPNQKDPFGSSVEKTTDEHIETTLPKTTDEHIETSLPKITDEHIETSLPRNDNPVSSDEITTPIETKREELLATSSDSIEEPIQKNHPEIYDSFFEYFYEENMTAEEKKKVDVSVKELLVAENLNRLKGYAIAQQLYGETLEEKCSDIKLVRPQTVAFNNFLGSIRMRLQKQKWMHPKDTMEPYFKNYFYEENMSDNEKKETDEILKNLISSGSIQHFLGYKVAQQLYGEELDQICQEISLEKKEKTSFMNFIDGTKRRFDNPNIKKTTRPTYFLEYFYEEEMSDFEKKKIEKTIHDFVEKGAMKHLLGYEPLQKLYGKNLDEKLATVKLDYEESCHIQGVVQFIRRDLKKQTTFPEIDPIHEELVEEIDSPLVEDDTIEELFPDFHDERFLLFNQENDYFRKKAIALLEKFQDIDMVLAILEVDIATLIDCYIEHLDQLSNVYIVVEYIVNNVPSKIKALLESSYFSDYAQSLTVEEQEVIYLKLLAISNQEMTDEVISMITDIPADTLATYQIMTKFDSINDINFLLKK